MNAAANAMGYCQSMRGAIPCLVAVTLIGLAVWFAMAAPLIAR
jgi:hypothetical protein